MIRKARLTGNRLRGPLHFSVLSIGNTGTDSERSVINWYCFLFNIVYLPCYVSVIKIEGNSWHSNRTWCQVTNWMVRSVYEVVSTLKHTIDVTFWRADNYDIWQFFGPGSAGCRDVYWISTFIRLVFAAWSCQYRSHRRASLVCKSMTEYWFLLV
jgi:hypothetical protein